MPPFEMTRLLISKVDCIRLYGKPVRFAFSFFRRLIEAEKAEIIRWSDAPEVAAAFMKFSGMDDVEYFSKPRFRKRTCRKQNPIEAEDMIRMSGKRIGFRRMPVGR